MCKMNIFNICFTQPDCLGAFFFLTSIFEKLIISPFTLI